MFIKIKKFFLLFYFVFKLAKRYNYIIVPKQIDYASWAIKGRENHCWCWFQAILPHLSELLRISRPKNNK
jgi:hypothetical protein